MIDEQMKVLSILAGEGIKSVKLHPVNLELVFRENGPYMENMWLEHYENESGNKELYNSTLKQIKKNGWDTIVLSKQNLTVFSLLTGNKDDRGGGCGIYGFKESDFVWNITNESGITFRDVVECVYRMKGSKYDFWYEMYVGIKLIEETEDSYRIEVIFDYSS